MLGGTSYGEYAFTIHTFNSIETIPGRIVYKRKIVSAVLARVLALLQ